MCSVCLPSFFQAFRADTQGTTYFLSLSITHKPSRSVDCRHRSYCLCFSSWFVQLFGLQLMFVRVHLLVLLLESVVLCSALWSSESTALYSICQWLTVLFTVLFAAYNDEQLYSSVRLMIHHISDRWCWLYEHGYYCMKNRAFRNLQQSWFPAQQAFLFGTSAECKSSL